MNNPTLDLWFTYHPPTQEQAPHYAAIRLAECNAADLCGWLARCIAGHDSIDSANPYDRVNSHCRAFAEVIVEYTPPVADQTAAIRCIRLARNALNEAISLLASPAMPEAADLERLNGIARDQLRMARWWASSAIACREPS
ncbi:MAG TPA: hypothetical protein VI911_04245 [Patescibacteria group bacterium]|nr:hypothetical protein [Patescibacteria group bacterium]